MTNFLTVAWLAGIIYSTVPCYWFLIHPFAARWQKEKESPFHIVLPLWLLIIMAAVALTWPWHLRTLYGLTPFSIVSPVPFFGWGLMGYSRIGRFGWARFVGLAEVRPTEHQQQLVTTGLHYFVRHPLYAAHLCMYLGWTFSSGLFILYVLLPVVLVLGAVMIRLEEHELQRRFGDAYREYAKHTPAILPLRFR